MVTEAELNAQESERGYSRLELAKVYGRLDNANLALKIVIDILKELRNVGDNTDQHSDDYLENLDDQIDTILHEWENMNGY